MRTVDARLTAADAAWQSLVARTAAAEKSGAASVSAEHVRAMVEDLKALRDAMRGELSVVDARLTELRRRADEIAAGSASPGAAHEGPPTPEDEDRWATQARDADPGVRFSALSRLGKARTERSVQVSVERLEDDDAKVVWLAVRNLGQFRDRDAAPRIAELLDHAEAVVRAAACDALVRMGAPADTGFDSADAPQMRKPAADRLKRWVGQ